MNACTGGSQLASPLDVITSVRAPGGQGGVRVAALSKADEQRYTMLVPEQCTKAGYMTDSGRSRAASQVSCPTTMRCCCSKLRGVTCSVLCSRLRLQLHATIQSKPLTGGAGICRQTLTRDGSDSQVLGKTYCIMEQAAPKIFISSSTRSRTQGTKSQRVCVGRQWLD